MASASSNMTNLKPFLEDKRGRQTGSNLQFLFQLLTENERALKIFYEECE